MPAGQHGHRAWGIDRRLSSDNGELGLIFLGDASHKIGAELVAVAVAVAVAV
jgi:hypothetical protein